MLIGFGLKTQSTYKYSPLNEVNAIRLLRLDDEPDACEDDVHGTLIHTTLDSAPPYFALSYCWGRLKQKDALFCDGKPLRITPSLAEALRRLRSLPSDQAQYPGWDLENRYFWIDQICINQADTEERQSQVQIMGHIYSHAIRTLIWLGPDPNGVAVEGFDLAGRLLRMGDDETRKMGRSTRLLATAGFDQRIANILQQLHLEHGSTNINSKPWSSFIDLTSRPWTTRLWVIQEVVLSAKEPIVLCGRFTCGWASFACAASFILSDPASADLVVTHDRYNCLYCINQIKRIRESGNNRPSLATLVNLTSYMFFTSNPRDKVFGLLGLAYEARNIGQLPEALQPDYRSKTARIYARVAKYFIMEHPQTLAPICSDLYAHPLPWTRNYSWSRSCQKRIPTWTPNWDHNQAISLWTNVMSIETRDPSSEASYTNPGYECSLEFDSRCSAAADSPVCKQPDGNSGHIKLRGIVVHTVTICLPVETAFGQRQRLHGRIRHVREYLSQEVRGEMQRLHKTADIIDRVVLTAYEIFSVFRQPLTLRILEAATARRPDIGPLFMLQILTRILTSTTTTPSHDATFDLNEYYLSELRKLCTALVSLISDERRRTSRPKYFQEYDETLRALGGSEQGWEYRIGRICHGKRFFITAAGRMGIGPPCITKGDIVSVLYGSGVPFILRRKRSSKRATGFQRTGKSDLFAIIGPCYVDGIMKGEAVEAAREGRLQEQDFEIF